MGGEPLNHIRRSSSGLSYNNEVYQTDMELIAGFGFVISDFSIRNRQSALRNPD
jgi:hypothetical protein